MQHKQHKCDLRAVPVQHEQHEGRASALWPTPVQYEWEMNCTIAKRVKKIGFDNNTSENIFSFLKRFILYLEKIHNSWWKDENYEELSKGNFDI